MGRKGVPLSSSFRALPDRGVKVVQSFYHLFDNGVADIEFPQFKVGKVCRVN